MKSVRRAFIMSSIEQYLSLTINVTVLAVMARLLTPADIGHAVMGIGISAMALTLREFLTPDFLIQQQTIETEDLRTSVTLLFLVTFAVTIGVVAGSDAISRFYDAVDLQFFLLIVLMSAFAEVISQPIIAILRRNLQFGLLANIRVFSLLVTAITTVSLGALDFGYLSYAWGMLVGAVTLAVLAARFSHISVPDICRPSLASWRTIVEFGRYRGGSQAIDRFHEIVPQLVLGKVMSVASVGLYNRANTVCAIPDRIIMSAFYSMAFPALAAAVREGRNIKQAYLHTLSYLSVLYWPGVFMIALCADPLVRLILGPQWHEAILLVRLLSLAAVFWFATIVSNPLLLALGKNRDAFLASLMARSIAATVLCGASTYGITAMAISQFISVPVQLFISLGFTRKHLDFTTSELVSALTPSVAVTVFTLSGPMLLLSSGGWDLQISSLEFAIMLPLAGLGWLVGLVLVRHPFLEEVQLISQFIVAAAARVRLHYQT